MLLFRTLIFWNLNMTDYRPNEIIDMIMILSENRNNYAAAARLYA